MAVIAYHCPVVGGMRVIDIKIGEPARFVKSLRAC